MVVDTCHVVQLLQISDHSFTIGPELLLQRPLPLPAILNGPRAWVQDLSACTSILVTPGAKMCMCIHLKDYDESSCFMMSPVIFEFHVLLMNHSGLCLG